MTCNNAALVFMAAFATVLSGEPAAAQVVQPTSQGQAQGLEFFLDAFGGWEADLSDTLVEPVDLLGETSGGLAGVNASLQVGHQGEHVAVGASGGTFTRWYPAFADELVPGYTGTFSVGSSRERRTSWNVSQALSYAPFNLLSLYGDGILLGPVPIVDYQISTAMQLVSDTSANLGYHISRRGQISLRAGYNIVDGDTEDGGGDWRRWNAGGLYSHQVSRHLSAYGGYNYWESDSAEQLNRNLDGVQPALSTIEAGVNYARTLSFSRRTTFSFRTGSSAVDYGNAIEYQVIGNATLQHQIGRTWDLQGGYERRVGFVETFAEPAVLDTVTFSSSGRTSRRTAIQAFANYSTGSVGQGSIGNDLDSAWASVQFRWGIAERLAMFAQYFYFQSEFGPLVDLPQSLGRDQRRSGVRVGLSLGTTLLGPRR
jgi:hypothetical protein